MSSSAMRSSVIPKRAYHSLAYLCKMAPMAKIKYAHFLKLEYISTVLRKIYHEKLNVFKTENTG